MTDYYHVGLPSAISDNHQDHAEDEQDAPQLDWSVALILRPMTLQQFLGDHFKDFREKQEHKELEKLGEENRQSEKGYAQRKSQNGQNGIEEIDALFFILLYSE